MNANLESMIPRELPAGMQQGIVLPGDQQSNWENTPRSILRSTLTVLSEGRISDAVAQFDDRFKFNDHALALEFTDKPHLTEFFQKARELFPDTALEVVRVQITPLPNGSLPQRRLCPTGQSATA